MAPVKFDDLNKVAKSVLSDDYINMGSPFQFKAKQKVPCGTVTTTVDLNQDGKNATSGVVSWKLSNPMGISGLAVDKFEYNKSGGMKLEGTVNKSIHKVEGLSVEFKTDLKELSKLKKGITYTGLADTQVKFETAILKPDAFTAEVTRVQGPATVGAKVVGSNVDVGLRMSVSGLFTSLVVTKGFSSFEGAAHYKVNKNLEVAAIATKDGKGVGAIGGIKFVLNDAMTLKAKATDKGVAHVLATYKPAKGFTVHSGASFGKDVSYGVQLNIE